MTRDDDYPDYEPPGDDERPLDWIDPKELEADAAAAAAVAAARFPSRPSLTDAPPPPPLTDEETAARLASACWEACVRGAMNPMHGYPAGPAAYKAMLDNYLAEVGPTGPVEEMLAEQLFLAHHVSGLLHVKGMHAGAPEPTRVYLAAAARLMAEFRQSALALKAVRAPAVAAAPPAAVAAPVESPPPPAAAPAPPPTPPAPPKAGPPRGELGSKRKRPGRRARADAFP
jgi:hypothetical protein